MPDLLLKGLEYPNVPCSFYTLILSPLSMFCLLSIINVELLSIFNIFYYSNSPEFCNEFIFFLILNLKLLFNSSFYFLIVSN